MNFLWFWFWVAFSLDWYRIKKQTWFWFFAVFIPEFLFCFSFQSLKWDSWRYCKNLLVAQVYMDLLFWYNQHHQLGPKLFGHFALLLQSHMLLCRWDSVLSVSCISIIFLRPWNIIIFKQLKSASITSQIYFYFSTGKSLSEALLFAEHGENMMCTKIVLNVRNNFCTQHVLPRFELVIQWKICRHIVG